MDYVVSYDIENNKIRTKIFNELKYLGYLHIQKSVFLGIDISQPIYFKTKKMFNDLNVDSYFIVKIKLKNFESNFFSYKNDDILLI